MTQVADRCKSYKIRRRIRKKTGQINRKRDFESDTVSRVVDEERESETEMPWAKSDPAV